MEKIKAIVLNALSIIGVAILSGLVGCIPFLGIFAISAIRLLIFIPIEAILFVRFFKTLFRSM